MQWRVTRMIARVDIRTRINEQIAYAFVAKSSCEHQRGGARFWIDRTNVNVVGDALFQKIDVLKTN